MIFIAWGVGMGAGGAEPPPIVEDADGGVELAGSSKTEQQTQIERIKKTNNDLFVIINSFLVCQN